MRHWLNRIARRARALVQRRTLDREVDVEMQLHIELETEELMFMQGLPREEARRQALVAFGGVQRYKEAHRDARGVRWLEELGTDIRYAVRSLRRTPAFSLSAVIVLAL